MFPAIQAASEVLCTVDPALVLADEPTSATRRRIVNDSTMDTR